MNLRPLHHLPALALLGATAAQAADAGYLDVTSFLAAAGSTASESFEDLPGSVRSLAPITTALFTLNTAGTPIGIQTAADAPSTGYGSAAVDGSHYVSVYLPDVSQGSITFHLSAPATAFGLYLADIGEVAGDISFKTDVGAFSVNLNVGTHPPLLPNGNVRFVGFTQTQAFTQVTLTVTGLDDAYGLDKVYVSAVPEPTSALLMGLGLAGLWAARRRR